VPKEIKIFIGEEEVVFENKLMLHDKVDIECFKDDMLGLLIITNLAAGENPIILDFVKKQRKKQMQQIEKIARKFK